MIPSHERKPGKGCAGILLLSAGLLFLVACSPDESAYRADLPVPYRSAAVVSADTLATKAGLEVLRRGGNAIDAAVAVAFALAVTYPEAGNLGGGGFMLLRLANGTNSVIDFRETAPAAATRDMFLDEDGEPIPEASQLGPRSAGVPGTVHGLMTALDLYGSLPRHVILEPSIRLAEEGFVVNERFAASLNGYSDVFGRTDAVRETFFKDSATVSQGALVRQPDLARTLRLIRDHGSEGFYEGKTADRIVASMEPGDGIITRKDLQEYRATEREALVGSYRGYAVITVPPPSFGGVILLQMLNVLENFDFSGKEALSAVALHTSAASAQYAFTDRFLYASDPDYRPIPVEELTSKAYAHEKSLLIDLRRATPGDELQVAAGSLSDGETTHFCVLDSMGNIVSATTSLNDLYGSKVFVEGGGFFLNNVMDDFSVKPGTPNLYGLTGGEENEVSGGRRMVSSMTPTIVLQGSNPRIVLGARGGSRIPTSLVQVIMNVIDFNLALYDAVEIPRIHHQWDPDILYYDGDTMPEKTLQNLRRLGYTVELLPSSPGRVQALEMVDGFVYGVSDPREGGTAGGY